VSILSFYGCCRASDQHVQNGLPTSTKLPNTPFHSIPKLRNIARRLIWDIIRKVIRLKNPALDIDDETDEEDDLEFDWRRLEVAPYLPCVDKKQDDKLHPASVGFGSLMCQLRLHPPVLASLR